MLPFVLSNSSSLCKFGKQFQSIFFRKRSIKHVLAQPSLLRSLSMTPGNSANLYSLIETAKANGLEPYAYLRHVYTELPQAETVEAIEALCAFDPAISQLTKVKSVLQKYKKEQGG